MDKDLLVALVTSEVEPSSHQTLVDSCMVKVKGMSVSEDVPFVPGLDLGERFFFELVKPLLDEHYPSLDYVACRLGEGSDVLGFDTDQSRDHDWGPKFDLLLETDEQIPELNAFFDEHLRGKAVCGYSTQFRKFCEQDGHITLINAPNDEENTCHGIRIITIRQFFTEYLNWSIDSGPPTYEDWLTFPSQHLLTIAQGRVFHDSDRMKMQQIRSQLAYYPRDVWLYAIGCCWQRIGQEEHLMGRAGQAGDELGSALIANRLIRDIIRLVFLLERRFFPYAKWFGTAFRRSTTYGTELESILRQAQVAATWRERESHLCAAYHRLAAITNEKLSGVDNAAPFAISTDVAQFHGRPFRVINGGVIAEAIFARIEDSRIERLPKIGSIDLFIDSTDAMFPELRMKMKTLFQ